MALKFSRRDSIRLLGAAVFVGVSGSGWSATGTPTCVVRPAQTEGPYFLDTKLNRADIRVDPSDGSVRAGVPLEIVFRVSRLADDSCSPLRDAIVDVWQCDALGVYSGYRDSSGHFDTRGRSFLRGYQSTDAGGTARFRTIYPGWYPGRAAHIHFNIRTSPERNHGSEFTSQLYFDDAISDAVYAKAPYAQPGRRRTTNTNDGIFRRGGQELILPLGRSGEGYAGTFEIALRR